MHDVNRSTKIEFGEEGSLAKSDVEQHMHDIAQVTCDVQLCVELALENLQKQMMKMLMKTVDNFKL